MANQIQIPGIDCLLPRPDIAELSEAVRVEFSKRLLGGAPVLPLSAEDILAFIMAGTVNLMHGLVAQALKEQDPATMCCDNLMGYAARHGINLRGATRAKGYVALTGTAYAQIPSNLRLVGQSSREYKLDPAVTFNPVHLDANGGAVIRVTADLPGGLFNLPMGAALTTSAVTTGIDIDATVVGNGIQGGTDNESCEELRTRVLAAEASGILSTTVEWYIAQTMRYPGVTRVCTDGGECCCDPTNLILYPFMEGVYGTLNPPEENYGIPPSDVIAEMNHWMWGINKGKGEGLAPVGVLGRFACAQPVRVHVTAHCFRGCDNIAVSRIIDALNPFMRATYCTGAKICKEEFKCVIYRAIGERCFSDVTFAFDPPEAIRRIDDGYIVVECGWIPVLGDVFVTSDPAGVPVPEIASLPEAERLAAQQAIALLKKLGMKV